jgi:tetratricopeptide (TPR) repeat protein
MYKHFFKALEVLKATSSVDEVFQHVEQIEVQADRESTFVKLAKFFARQGRTDQASRFAFAIRDEHQRILCLQEVARVLRRKGLLELGQPFIKQACEEAANFKGSNWDTANLFLSLSSELYEFGDASEALALLYRAMALAGQDRGEGASKFLCVSSMQLTKLKRPEEARAVAEKIGHNWFRRHALAELEKSFREPQTSNEE